MLLEFEGEPEDVAHVQNEDQKLEYGDVVEFINGKKTVRKAVKICSCGNSRCGAIALFGTPEPVFHRDIEPLGPQFVRDQRAIALVREGVSE